MVALPPPTMPTVDAMDAVHYDAQETRHYQFIRGSSIGEKCERKIWYKWRWCHEPEKFTGRMLRLFETGHREEERLINELKSAGVHVEEFDPETQKQWMVTALNGHFRGHADGILTGVLEAPQTKHLFEAKTHSEKSFAQLLKHGVTESKPEHIAQMQVYMGHLGLSRAFYLAKNKNTDELYSERIEFDQLHFAALMAKAGRVMEAHKPPPRISDDPNYFLCKSFNCPSYGVCHGNEWSLRNCRTCIHSTPVMDGEWNCERHNRNISLEEQEQGCPNHIYLPDLVPGELIGSEPEKEIIRYKMPDGSEWIDGMGEVK